MPFARDNEISREPIDGGIEITDQQYQEALAGMMEGKVVFIGDGFSIDFPPEATAPEVEPEPVDPLTLFITKRQFNAALILGAGQTEPDGFVISAIETISDPVQRALALNDWRHAPWYERSHPLFNDPAMLTATGMDAAQINGLWLLAVQQPA